LKIDIFRENFPNPIVIHKWLTQPEQQKIDPTLVKNFYQDPSIEYELIITLFGNIPICFILLWKVHKYSLVIVIQVCLLFTKDYIEMWKPQL